jgi:hypothetical protein
MAGVSNVSSTRRTIRALRRHEVLTEQHAALATLALTTAQALDDVVAGTSSPSCRERTCSRSKL